MPAGETTINEMDIGIEPSLNCFFLYASGCFVAILRKSGTYKKSSRNSKAVEQTTLLA